jgi:hypothetical protein
MTGDGYITCICGYELFVPVERQGRLLECLHCGAEIDTSPENIHGREVAAPSDSPFEDGDTPTQRNTQRPMVPREPVSEFSASVFEDENEVDEEEVDRPDPALLRVYTDPEHSSAYLNVQNAEKCSRCGNPYRGEWDKQVEGDKTICYICSNQATEKIPNRILQRGAVAPNLDTARAWDTSLNTQIPDGPIEEKFWLFDPESGPFRSMLYWMIAGLLLVTVASIIYSGLDAPSPSSSRSAGTVVVQDDGAVGALMPKAGAEPEMPQWAIVLVWLIIGLSGFVAQFFTFYAVLLLTNRLPHGEWKRDVMIIGLTEVAVTGIIVANLTVGYFLSAFLTGILGYMMSTVFFGFLWFITVINMLDFRIRDFFYFAVLSVPIYLLLSLFTSFIYAAIAAVVL